MTLTLKNIGKIRSACVEIDGITVIAGENNTGKSTVGRALFAVFNSFCRTKEKIDAECISKIDALLLLHFITPISKSGLPLIGVTGISKTIVQHKEDYLTKRKDLRREIPRLLEEYGIQIEMNSGTEQYNQEIADRIGKVLQVSDEEYFLSSINKGIDAEYKGQARSDFSEENGEIQLHIKGDCISVVLGVDGVCEIRNPVSVSLHTEALYLDDPFVLDEQQESFRNFVDHRNHLYHKLFKEQSGNLVDEVLAKQLLETVYQKISSVCEGEVFSGKKGQVEYRSSDGKRALNIRNISTGIKTFAILKKLLMNGALSYGGVLILDEPEIHLHPEWQLVLAEWIVLLQKELRLHIIVNTHSPYFLRAIQVYSAKHKTADVCKYYLSEAVGEQAETVDVTDCVEKIYEKLARPLQELEDIRWQDG